MITAEAIAVPMSEETPVKMHHGKTVGRFAFYTKLLSTPRYNEIDPTILVAIFFPIFFGLMVGDMGYGIPFTILGCLGSRRPRARSGAPSPPCCSTAVSPRYSSVSSCSATCSGIEFVALHPSRASCPGRSFGHRDS